MQKLPGIEVVKQSWRFLMADLGTIIRLAWLPLLIVSIVQFFVSRAALQGVIEAIQSGNLLSAFVGQSIWPGLISTLLALLGGAIVAVAIHRVILFGDRKDGTFIYFNFGKVEALFAAIPIVLGIIVMLLFGSLFAGLMAAGGGANFGYLMIVLAIAAVIVFFSVRLSPLWPIIVVEERYDFRQAWELSQGNFWRLFGTFVLGILPFVVVLIIVGYLLQSAGMMNVTTTEQLVAALQRAIDLQPIQAVIAYVLTILISGMSVALLSYSYKALKGYGPDDLVK